MNTPIDRKGTAIDHLLFEAKHAQARGEIDRAHMLIACAMRCALIDDSPLEQHRRNLAANRFRQCVRDIERTARAVP